MIFLAIGAGAWWGLGARGVVQYRTTVASRGDVSRTVTATGTVNPVLTIIVGTYVSGVIQQLYCDYNTQVKKGQVCAKIDPRPYQTLVDQDKANLAVARAQLEKDKANLAYAKLNYDRNVWLVEHNFVSQDARDSAKSIYDQAQAQVNLDKATIEQRHAELDAAKINLEYTDIISPVDGTVVSRNVTHGPDSRRQLPDPDALSDRHRSHQDAGRHQRQRERHRRHQGRRCRRASPSTHFPSGRSRAS